MRHPLVSEQGHPRPQPLKGRAARVARPFSLPAAGPSAGRESGAREGRKCKEFQIKAYRTTKGNTTPFPSKKKCR